MKLYDSQNRIDLLNKVIIAIAFLFVVISFLSFYMITVLENEGLLVNITNTLLIIDLILLIAFSQVLKDEKKAAKNFSSYTLKVARK